MAFGGGLSWRLLCVLVVWTCLVDMSEGRRRQGDDPYIVLPEVGDFFGCTLSWKIAPDAPCDSNAEIKLRNELNAQYNLNPNTVKDAMLMMPHADWMRLSRLDCIEPGECTFGTGTTQTCVCQHPCPPNTIFPLDPNKNCEDLVQPARNAILEYERNLTTTTPFPSNSTGTSPTDDNSMTTSALTSVRPTRRPCACQAFSLTPNPNLCFAFISALLLDYCRQVFVRVFAAGVTVRHSS